MASVSEVILLIRWSGMPHVLRILRYTLFRDRLDRKYRRFAASHRDDAAQNPGRMLEAEAIPSGARFRFENASLEAVFLAPDLIRISWEPGRSPIPYALAKREWGEVESRLSETSEGNRLFSADLQILVKTDGGLRFQDSNGILIRDENPPELRGTAEDPSWTSLAHPYPEECFYGLGEQTGPLNLRGTSHRMWNHDPGGSYGPGSDPIYMPIPIYMGLHRNGSYLIFYENPFPASISFADIPASSSDVNPITSASFDGGMLRYYLIPGPPQRALRRYTELTGRAGLPPMWSLGYHQSRWGYKSEADIREVVAGFKQYDLPLSAIHLDIDYMDGYRVFTVNQERFPNLASLTDELDQAGIKLVTILDPGVKQDPKYFLYREGLEEGHFCKLPDGKHMIGMVWPGRSAYPDFTNPETRRWWAAQYPRLLKAGIAGIWHDMNEPTSFTAWGDPSLPLATQHNLEGQGGDHRQAHNLYALLMNRAGHEALREQRPEHRPWIFSRSGWASQQSYAWKWSADADSTWPSMRSTIANTLGIGLSGFPYTGPDIGGFSGNPSAELYLRWFQLATFMPFFRTHSAIGTDRREPWVYGEPYTSILREFLRLRYRLLPYLYSLSWEASQSGTPLVRPLFWNELENRVLWEVEDAFLLGDNLLIAPIVEEGVTRRRAVLPRGGWYSFWDNTTFQGPGSVELEASLERIPVLVRAGSALPLVEEERLSLHIYPPDALNSQEITGGYLYSDSGEGYGGWRLDRFTLSRAKNNLEMTWQSEGDNPFPYRQIELHLHGIQAGKAWIDDRETALEGNRVESDVFQKIRFEQ